MEISKEDYDRIKTIKEKWNKKEIDISEISDSDAKIIAAIYDMEIKNTKAEIKELENKILEYEERMKDAIKLLKNNK